LVVVGDNSVPISRNHCTNHATFYYTKGSKVKYYIASLDISLFEISADRGTFVNLAIGFFVIGD
jgi:hypothetical protein